MAEDKVKRRYWSAHRIINASMFVATGMLLLLLFPRGGKFEYEYQNGKHWMHDALVAPFDFPIYKSEQDLKLQKDSILKNFTLYFNYNPKISIDEKTNFRQYFNGYWNYFNRRFPDLLNVDYRIQIEQKISTLLDFVYKKGIIELPEDFNTLSKQTSVIRVVRNNVAEETEIDEVFTAKRAYEYVNHQLAEYIDNLSTQAGINPDAFFHGLNLEGFFVPNLYYDEGTSEKMRDDELDNLSLTEGMVLTGERIIFPGDIINAQNFKVLESFKKEYEARIGKSSNYIFVLLGQAILVTICIILVFVFINKFRRNLFQVPKRIGFLLFVVLLFSAIASFIISFRPYALYMVPFAILPILLKTFYDTKIAIYLHTITIVLIGFWAPNGFEFVFLNVAIGYVALLSLTNLYRRNKMFVTAAWVMLTYFALYAGLSLYQEGSLKNFSNDNLLYFFVNGFLVLSSIPLIYIFEKIFGFLSDATLLELSDSNQPLLRKLAEIAPGTFQHSLQVANLAEEAIFKIGGNPLLVRAGSLYHDIGKMENPMYFIENLSDEINPHENLDFEKSIEIIVGHVLKGIEIGKKYRLPEPIIEFIRTHHGTSTVHYFYRSYIKKYPGSDVDLNKFSYPGPKPYTKELAVVMMADSVEAASRSLKQYSEKDLYTLIENIISGQLKEGQYNDANITLKDIEMVKSTFKKRLRNIYHIRIEYPKAIGQ
jgi:putative nucleotidyltransferase with HDIG domain